MAASVAVHAVLLTLVAIQAPRLKIPPMVSGPPEAVIPVLIVPRVPPPATATGTRPAEIRLHRRPQRFADETLPVKPLITPTAPPTKAAPSEGPKTVAPSPAQDALAVNARNALRSRLGCDDRNLTRAEREGCMDRFADGARDAPFLGLGIEGDKARGLAAAAAQRERDYKYQRSMKGSAPATGSLPWDTTRGPPSPSEAMGNMVGADQVAKKIPF